MRSRWILVTGLAFVLSLCTTAQADPIMGTITLTVAPALPYASVGPGIPQVAIYTSGPVNLSALPQNFFLSGPALGFEGGVIQDDVQTTFDMKIAFNSTSGSQPYVDVHGTLFGGVASFPGFASSNFSGTPSSASLQDWAVGSGVPMALIDQYMNLASYQSISQGFGGTSPPETGQFVVQVGPMPETAAPEPSAVLTYLAAIAVLGMRRAWRRCSAAATVGGQAMAQAPAGGKGASAFGGVEPAQSRA